MSARVPDPAIPEGSLRRPVIPIFALLAVIGLLAHFAVFLFVSIPLGEGPPEPREEAFVIYSGNGSGGDSLAAEQGVLFDSRPLFVPTRWNVASSLQGIARLLDETELFALFEPETRLQQNDHLRFAAPFLEEIDVPDQVVPVTSVYPLRGFGQIRLLSDAPPLDPRPGLVQVESLESGALQFEMPLPGSLQAPGQMWTPVVFLVEVNASAVGAPPLRLSGSGVSGWDAALADFLASASFLRKLPPGYFRVTIGP